ncbi:hypothetical protein BDV96DRAFT_561105 [Lophiotrema nucula]|uniref:Uncharacterized protein n=1 Tax=Lophiotrema nucula TaxID=690887 RepID=A0A6A5ZU73_9PLEO|nr:hypothetical protein BDV96DRAFT_561105 [Lophiotrema nucula]
MAATASKETQAQAHGTPTQGAQAQTHDATPPGPTSATLTPKSVAILTVAGVAASLLATQVVQTLDSNALKAAGCQTNSLTYPIDITGCFQGVVRGVYYSFIDLGKALCDNKVKNCRSSEDGTMSILTSTWGVVTGLLEMVVGAVLGLVKGDARQ